MYAAYNVFIFALRLFYFILSKKITEKWQKRESGRERDGENEYGSLYLFSFNKQKKKKRKSCCTL